MKLFYYQRPDGLQNFGDQLNAWLWHRLLPGYFNEDETILFVGIGTLLNDLLPQRVAAAENVIIFSTGAGYEKPLTTLPNHWKIYCVRGPYSAQKLGLSANLAIADAGILVRRLFPTHNYKRYPFAYMPHIHQAKSSGKVLQQTCEKMGWGYINPSDPIEQILTQINQTQILLTEAMHGAIVADALRVRWLPIITSPKILKFKWKDWCSSIQVPYQPYSLYPLVPGYPRYGRGIRSALAASLHWGQSLMQFSPFTPYSLEQQLLKVATMGKPILSAESHLEQLTIQLEEKLEQLKQDIF